MTREPDSACLRAVTHALAGLAFALISVATAGAAKLGGPYFVDDAEIGKVGSCENEQWASSARNGDHIYVFSPACVFSSARPSRSERTW